MEQANFAAATDLCVCCFFVLLLVVAAPAAAAAAAAENKVVLMKAMKRYNEALDDLCGLIQTHGLLGRAAGAGEAAPAKGHATGSTATGGAGGLLAAAASAAVEAAASSKSRRGKAAGGASWQVGEDAVWRSESVPALSRHA